MVKKNTKKTSKTPSRREKKPRPRAVKTPAPRAAKPRLRAPVTLKPVDREFYARRVRDFLPTWIVDVHAHVWRQADTPVPSAADPRVVSWPRLVAAECTIESLLETYRLLLPGKQVLPLIFGNLPTGGNLAAINAYTAHAARAARVPALIFSDPCWTAEEFEPRIRAANFIGAKSYLTLAPDHIPSAEVRILDFFPPHQLDVLNQHGWIMMLHLPRSGRLRDPLNLAQLREIDRYYPNIRLIVAHVGRAYCDHDVGDAFAALADTRSLCFDISANTNARVFELLLRAVGPRRVLYGTDLPIECMRMRRVERDGRYVNIVPRGLYGDVSHDPNMGDVDGDEAAALTLFLYEEIDAFRRAAEAVKLSRADIDSVFAGNATRLLTGAGWRAENRP